MTDKFYNPAAEGERAMKQELREIAMYGMTSAQVEEHIVSQKGIGGKDMLMCSMLSDVQCMIEHGDTDQARKTLNQVKYIIMKVDYDENDEFYRERRKKAKEGENNE